jgi:cephalosporin hydroxylase
LVLHDAGQAYERVLEQLRAYGPLAAVTLFLREGGEKEFVQDASCEQMGITFNPGGWLLRK